MDKKKLTLPIKIIIIGFIIGLVVAGIGGVRELNADKTNKQRAKDALKASKEAVEKANKRLEEIGTEYVTLPEMIKIYNDKGYKVEKLEDIMSNGELKYKVKMLIRNKKEAK